MWRRRAVRCGSWRRRRRAVARRVAEAGACTWRRHLPAVAAPEPLQMAAALVPSEVVHADFLAGQRHLVTNIHRRHGRRGSSTSPSSGGGHEREVETLRQHRDALARSWRGCVASRSRAGSCWTWSAACGARSGGMSSARRPRTRHAPRRSTPPPSV
uniref:Uncharacterized protein n=1 Tax=Arundo donax TaxID=35708 RepID=A0A0A9DLD1_ARUDO